MHIVLLKDFCLFTTTSHFVGKLKTKKDNARNMKAELPGKGQRYTPRKNNLSVKALY